MFKLKKLDTVYWPVEFERPSDTTPGKADKHSFDGLFKQAPQSEVEKLLEDIKGDVVKSDGPIAKKYLVGWKGIQTEDGADLPFSESARDELLETPGVASAVVKSFFAASYGSKRKN